MADPKTYKHLNHFSKLSSSSFLSSTSNQQNVVHKPSQMINTANLNFLDMKLNRNHQMIKTK